MLFLVLYELANKTNLMCAGVGVYLHESFTLRITDTTIANHFRSPSWFESNSWMVFVSAFQARFLQHLLSS